MESEGQETIQPKKNDDGFIAVVILVIASVIGLYLLINYWRSSQSSRQSFQSGGGFSPPPERAAYLEAKETLDTSKPAELDELKKLLMKRALKAIPIVLSLQNEGSSIERLYKKGMLTDDMHFKVKELKAFVDAEFQEVQAEAEELLEGWGQMIWPQAMQFHQMIQKQQGDGKPDETEDGEEKPEGEKEAEMKKKESGKSNKKENKKSPAKEVSLPTSEEARAAEAERNARLLLEEEEREKQRNAKKGGNKGNKPSKK